MSGGRAFVKGQPKPPGSGRKKGSKNKKRLARVADVLAEADLHPIKEVVQILLSGNLKDGERAKLWLELQSYCEAKPKASPEELGEPLDPDDFSEVPTDELLKLVKPEGA